MSEKVVQNFATAGAETYRDPSYKDRGEKLHLRNSSWAVEVKNVDDDNFFEIEKFGDKLGYLYWEHDKVGPRKTGGWSPCWPVIHIGNLEFRPIHQKTYQPDMRWKAKTLAIPPEYPGPPPVGTVGVAVCAIKEDGEQEGLFISPSVSRDELKAPNKHGAAYSMGTNVYEMQGDQLDYSAKLQRVFRVIKPLGGSVSVPGVNGRVGAFFDPKQEKKKAGPGNGKGLFKDIVNVGIQRSDGTFGGGGFGIGGQIKSKNGKIGVGIQNPDGSFGGGGFGKNFQPGVVGVQGSDPKGAVFQRPSNPPQNGSTNQKNLLPGKFIKIEVGKKNNA